jgi:signal-transduction protein with cAMP-binding, CBS, and nucleotidyltransferase domain
MPIKDEDQSGTVNHWDTLVARMMTPGVVQIPGDISVTEAASLLEREQTPCLLVKDTESHFGLMTPADIVKKVVAQGLEPDDIEVRTIMTRPVQFIEYDRVIDEASSLMMATGTPILIVTKQEQPVGVLTARDLILSPKRCHTNIPATLRILEGTRLGAEHRASIVQLSHVGASVESPTSLLPDTTVSLNFSLPDLTSSLTIRGTVLSRYDQARSTGKSPFTSTSNVDIQFANLSPADQSSIKAWVLQNTPKSSDPA